MVVETISSVVPFIDLGRQYQSIKDEIDLAIQNVLDKGQFVLGENVNQFEKEFADYCGTEYGIGVSSGTDALTLALLASGISRDDEVITTPYTFVSSVDAISHVGATPVFVDIEEEFYTIDADKIEEKITDKTKAILPIHLYGHPADMDKILKIADDNNMKVIEDACQAHGAELNGKKAGSFGGAGCFSFYPTKNLGAYGEGGMVVTNDESIADKIRTLRHIGQKERYRYEVIGYNSRLHEMQAAILRVKLKYLDRANELRRNHAEQYNELLAETGLILPKENSSTKHVYHLYATRANERDKLKAWLEENGIGAMTHYPLPVHLQNSYAHLNHKNADFPVSERCAEQILSLPMFPELRDDEIEKVADVIRKWGE